MIKIWQVFETKAVTKSLNCIPIDILHKYKAWVEIIKQGGSRNLKNYPGFKDKMLKGNLRKCRSSRLNIQYRVIYTEEKELREIIVISVTPHKYEEIK